MINAILFDMDDLMVNSAPLHIEASRRVFSRFGVDILELPFETVKSYFGKRVSEIVILIAEHFNLDKKVDIKDLIEERERVFLEMVSEGVEPMPGLYELTNMLKQSDYKRCVASSGTKVYIEAVIKKLGLDGFFETIVSGDMVSKGKPDPEVFLKAAGVLNVQPKTCLVLEDSTHGIEAAKNAGMFCIGVENQMSPYKQDLSRADRIVTNLGEIDQKLLEAF